LGFGLTAFAHNLVAVSATVAVWTLGEIVFAPINASVVADASPQNLRGRYQGAFGMTWSLAMVVSPAVGPTLIEHTSLNTLWAITFIIGLGVAAMYLLVPNRVLPSGERV
jgi:MFS family permease